MISLEMNKDQNCCTSSMRSLPRQGLGLWRGKLETENKLEIPTKDAELRKIQMLKTVFLDGNQLRYTCFHCAWLSMEGAIPTLFQVSWL